MVPIVLIQMMLFSVSMAQQQFGDSNLDGLWFHITSAGNPFLPSSSPCLSRGQGVLKRDDYTYTPGISGHKVHTLRATWNEARRTCEEEGGHLAVINSIAESNAIAKLIQHVEKVNVLSGDTFWYLIGFHDSFQEGEYVTIHGQSLAKAGFTQWAEGQPDHNSEGKGGEEDCGSMYKGGGLNDISCDLKYGFVCELPQY